MPNASSTIFVWKCFFRKAEIIEKTPPKIRSCPIKIYRILKKKQQSFGETCRLPVTLGPLLETIFHMDLAGWGGWTVVTNAPVTRAISRCTA